jgi:hypothetical protein
MAQTTFRLLHTTCPSCSASRQDGRAFEFASAHLRKSEAVVALALREFRDICMLKFVPREYRDNEAFMLRAVASHECVVNTVNTNHVDPSAPKYVYAFYKCKPCVHMNASDRLRESRECVLDCVRKNGATLHYASSR